VVSGYVFSDKLFQYLCQPVELVRRGGDAMEYDGKREKADRQATVLRLLDRLQSNNEASDMVDMKSLLATAADANMYDVCIYILRKRPEANGSHLLQIVNLYLQKASEDAKFAPLPSSTSTDVNGLPNTNSSSDNGVSPVFDFLASTLSDATLPIAVVEKVRKHAIDMLPELVKANSNRTARLMVECFAAENDRFVFVACLTYRIHAQGYGMIYGMVYGAIVLLMH
jgi:hypothetical protein